MHVTWVINNGTPFVFVDGGRYWCICSDVNPDVVKWLGFVLFRKRFFFWDFAQAFRVDSPKGWTAWRDNLFNVAPQDAGRRMRKGCLLPRWFLCGRFAWRRYFRLVLNIWLFFKDGTSGRTLVGKHTYDFLRLVM